MDEFFCPFSLGEHKNCSKQDHPVDFQMQHAKHMPGEALQGNFAESVDWVLVQPHIVHKGLWGCSHTQHQHKPHTCQKAKGYFHLRAQAYQFRCEYWHQCPFQRKHYWSLWVWSRVLQILLSSRVCCAWFPIMFLIIQCRGVHTCNLTESVLQSSAVTLIKHTRSSDSL